MKYIHEAYYIKQKSILMKNPNWLTMEEAMEYLKVKSKSTVYTIQEKYQITVSKINSIMYFKRADFDKMFETNIVANVKALDNV